MGKSRKNTASDARGLFYLLAYFHLLKTAHRDPLTRLPDRAALMTELKKNIALAQRHGHFFSIAIVDIDNLKAINDRYGHPAGDLVLQRFAKLLQKQMRASDYLCRYGGDEFVLLLPQTTAMGARAFAARLVQSASRLKIVYGNQRVATSISMGLVTYKSQKRSPKPDVLIKRADIRLYEAKKAGGNMYAAR